uniref:RNase H type-1 domain-containing protein n=1 Tax=Cannabis sativa TaxID=3483 RepID=A0A803Q747_CANSA
MNLLGVGFPATQCLQAEVWQARCLPRSSWPCPARVLPAMFLPWFYRIFSFEGLASQVPTKVWEVMFLAAFPNVGQPLYKLASLSRCCQAFEQLSLKRPDRPDIKSRDLPIDPDQGLSILMLLKHNFGVVARDDQANVMAGVIAPATGNVAEAKALLLALEWIQAINLSVRVIESDCKSLVDKIYSQFCNNFGN